MPALSTALPKLKTLETRHYRQLYFCGDLHGRFDLLTNALHNRQFDPALDLLVLVGDLIDRGAYCPQTIDFVLEGLSNGFVAMVTGNHDHYPIGDYNYWMRNDGGWFEDIRQCNASLAESLLFKLKALASEPLALELSTPIGKIGVVHGDVPDNNWHTLKALALKADAEPQPVEEPKWQRTLLSGRGILKARQLQQLESLRVTGIDYVVSGHVVVAEPQFICNRAYIDTGAYYTEQLTLISLPELIDGFANSIHRV